MFHCPAGGAKVNLNNIFKMIHENNSWAGPAPVEEQEQALDTHSRTWWNMMREVSPGLVDAGQDLARFTSDYYKCKKLRRTQDHVGHEWATLLTFGASVQTRGRWPGVGDQPSLLVGAAQSGSILLSAAGLIGAVFSVLKASVKAVTPR